MRIILDSGALIGETRGSARVRAVLRDAWQHREDISVPAGALTQVIRGGPGDALVNRLLKKGGTRVTIHDEPRARIAGRLLAESGTSDAIDALVVAEAVFEGGGTIVTADVDDMSRLAADQPEIDIVPV
jgi:predicted nucleic acid-binding protein